MRIPPGSGLFIFGGRYRRPFGAKAIEAVCRYVVRHHWKIITIAVTIAGVIVAA